jgi:hypothetical protein
MFDTPVILGFCAAGVVYQHVNPPEYLLGGLGAGGNILGARDVAGDRDRGLATGLGLPCQILASSVGAGG